MERTRTPHGLPIRLTRRTAIRTDGIATAASAPFLAGCNGGGAPQEQATTAVTKQPKRGGIITVSRLSSQLDRSFDPHTNSSIRDQCLRLIYQGVLGYDHLSLEIQPELAQMGAAQRD